MGLYSHIEPGLPWHDDDNDDEMNWWRWWWWWWWLLSLTYILGVKQFSRAAETYIENIFRIERHGKMLTIQALRLSLTCGVGKHSSYKHRLKVVLSYHTVSSAFGHLTFFFLLCIRWRMRKKVEHRCFTQIKQSDSFWNICHQSLQQKVVMLKTFLISRILNF